MRIGALGPMGSHSGAWRAGPDIVPELRPLPTEPVVDKPGKGAFLRNDLQTILQNRGIENLIVCGVTTEVCVNTPCARPTTAAIGASFPATAAAPTSPSFTRWASP